MVDRTVTYLMRWLRRQLDIDEQAAEMVDDLHPDLPEPPVTNRRA
ncbi:hypothetical protein [Micromonospora sp. KC213]|nr:hypothetical protein [Micromonospora sp. KC213]